MLAFNMIVKSVIEYASQVWSPHQSDLHDKLETKLRKAIRCYRIPKFDPLLISDYRAERDIKLCRRLMLDTIYLTRYN